MSTEISVLPIGLSIVTVIKRAIWLRCREPAIRISNTRRYIDEIAKRSGR